MKLKRWVIKAGSNLVCGGGPLLLRSWMQQVAELRRKHHIEVVWVTSGAIASAAERIHFRGGRGGAQRTLSEKQALSAIGQPMVMDLYNLALQAVGLKGGQILLTYDDLANSVRRKNFQNTVKKLLDWKVVPILNENDAVATEEIRFGDNDSLSARVARFVGADRLLILTDVEGLYEKDPKRYPGARLVRALDRVTPKLLSQLAATPGSSRGTGGMFSKVSAAGEAGKYGIETWLVRGDLPSVLTRVAGNEKVGTRIAKKRTKRG